MNPPANPETARLRIAWSAFAVLTAVVFWLWSGSLQVTSVYLLFGTPMIAAGVLSMAIMTTHHWALFRRFTQPENLLVCWTYAEDEWRDLSKRAAGGTGCLMLFLVALGLFGTYDMWSESAAATCFAWLVSLAAVAGMPVVARCWMAAGARRVIIARQGAYVSRALGPYVSWKPPASLEDASLVERDGHLYLELEMLIMGHRREAHSIAIPNAHRGEAEAVLGQINREG